MNAAVRAHLRRAELAADLSRHEQVERECRATLALDPQCVEAFELLAWSLMERRRNADALDVVGRGLAHHAGRAELHYIAGVVLHRSGRLAEARDRLVAAIAAGPSAARYRTRLARVFADQRENEAAADEARAAVDVAPDDPFVLGEAAVVLAAVGRADEAIAMAERRAAIEPENEWALAGVLRALLSAKRWDAAVRMARAAIARAPNRAWLWGMLAEALEASGNARDGEHAAREALRLSPDTLRGGEAAVRVLHASGDRHRAQRVADATRSRAESRR